jgi:hypothetical protein
MAPRNFCFTIVACLLCACAQMTSKPPLSPPSGAAILNCDTPACTVKVSVKCEAYIFCKIQSQYDWIQVRRDNSPVITWEVDTAGYTFSDAGIAFAAGSPFMCNPAEGRRRFICNDTHSAPGTYKYTITLIGFPFVLPKDPFIENQ